MFISYLKRKLSTFYFIMRQNIGTSRKGMLKKQRKRKILLKGKSRKKRALKKSIF